MLESHAIPGRKSYVSAYGIKSGDGHDDLSRPRRNKTTGNTISA
jgi:hypothetical protein